MKKAIVLLSGGLDSTTCLAVAKSQGFACYALTFNYGQRHDIELTVAKKIATHYQAEAHKIIDLPIGQFGGSALTDSSIAVPDYSASGDVIPITYVPARNTIFLSIALGWAEVLGAYDIFIGASSIDYSGYPDCRPEYFAAFQQLATLATKTGIEGNSFQIHAPLLYLSKAQTIQLGSQLGVDYGLTVTCYQADAEGRACGRCDSCVYRKKGFKEAQIVDSTTYAA